jgi:hypothetical protein
LFGFNLRYIITLFYSYLIEIFLNIIIHMLGTRARFNFIIRYPSSQDHWLITDVFEASLLHKCFLSRRESKIFKPVHFPSSHAHSFSLSLGGVGINFTIPIIVFWRDHCYFFFSCDFQTARMDTQLQRRFSKFSNP